MAEFSEGAALAFDYNATSGQTADFTPSGSNLAAFAIVSLIEFGSKTINECRLGGSGGSLMTRVGSDYSWNGTSCLTGLFELTSIAEDLTNAYSGWASNPLQSCIAAAVYSGVDQADPASDYTENLGSAAASTTTVATITIPNCVIGQRIAGAVSANADAINLTTFTPVAGQGTIRRQSIVGTYLGPAWVDKLATVTGDNTLQVNVNSSAVANLTWGFRAFRINDAAGGGSVFNPLTGRGGAAAQPLAA